MPFFFLLTGSSASRRVVAGQSSCRWSTDIKLGSTCGFWRLTSRWHSAFLQELVRVLRGARAISRAAFAEPSQGEYVAAKQFQTDKLLGDPGRRPDAAPKSRAEPAIQDTAPTFPSLEGTSSGRTIHPSQARRRGRRLPSQARRTLPCVRSLSLVVRTLPPWTAEGRA